VRIRNISIRGLFGAFDHEIPLFQKEPITIIHGPNGVGKTSILKLITGTLRPSFRLLRSVPFDSLALRFDDETTLDVRLETVGEEVVSRRGRPVLKKRSVHFRLMRDGVVEQSYTYTGPTRPPVPHRVEQYVPYLSRVSPEAWIDRRTDTLLQYEDVLRIYGQDLPEEMRGPENPTWLSDIQKSTPVHFIETQRLLNIKATEANRPSSETTVKQCATELASRISEALARSATLSQTLERSFPTRLISGTGTGPVALSEEEIRAKLNALDQKRSRLVEAGLLEPSHEPTLPTKRFDETTQRVLGVYIADTGQKLEVFDEMLSRIELIRSIVDARFLQKTISVNRKDGFVAQTRDRRPLDLSGLSSGEQHELVLLYELLFRAPPNTLILIDEPELSLHIAWQQQFLRDLLQITKLASLTALVATHSPQIIHDRWDLTVELLGPTR